MAEGTLMICMIQLTGIVAKQGLDQYLAHRRKQIEEGREDKLISSKIKKSVVTLQRSMTPERIQRPTLARQKRISFNEKVLNTVVDAVQPKSEIIDKLQEDLIPPLAEKLDDLYVKSKPIVEGRMSSILRSLTPTRMRSETKDVAVGSEDFRKFVADLLLFVQCEYELQREVPNSVLLKQKDFHIKLVRHLDELAKKKRETDA